MHALATGHAPATSTAAALSAYGNNSLAARIEGASPHALVQMLYDRLVSLVRAAAKAAAEGDVVARLKATARAIAIVDGLDATLDDEHGGDIAESLHAVYQLVSNRLLAGKHEGLEEAAEAIASIADAWRTIRP